MKKLLLYNLGIFLSISLLYISCNKKDMDLTAPLISEASFFTTEAEFRMGIIGAYASLTDYFSSASVGGANNSTQTKLFVLTGDDLTNDQPGNTFEYFSGLTPGNGDVSNFFRSSYVFLNRVNKVLVNIRTAPSGVFVTPNLKNNNEGEMLFLRAYGHYMLWNIFGKYAPIDTLNVSSLDQLNPPSSTNTQLLDIAIGDLTLAASLLPASWVDADKGRVTANSAYGLLGKCLVFRASVLKKNEDYQAAIAAFNKIVGVSLVNNYEDNFNFETENNSESLFEFQAGAPLRGSGSTNIWLANDAADIGVASAFYGSFGWWDTPNSWTNFIGGGFWAPTEKLKNAFESGDPRRAATFKDLGWSQWMDKYVRKNKIDATGASVNNNRILRYADVLLLQAEATIQSGGSTSEAVMLINKVRERARKMVAGGTLPAALDESTTNRTTIMQWVMDERLRELAAEGQRWFDLRRWSMGGTITLNNAFFSSTNVAEMKFEAKHLYFPIPYSELDKNKNITPTPGY